jgi:protein-disulfide isomerase
MTADQGGAVLGVPVHEGDHLQGPRTAPATLVEYGDFECPHCGRAYPIVKAVQRLMGPRLCFVYRHFPLTQMHPHAEPAAEAAEAAGAQRKFWEMHDLLFQRQDALEDEQLIEYADGLGLNAMRVTTELAAHVYRARVRADFMGGVKSGVNGTPTFFINGARYDASWDVETLGAAIEAAARR